MILCDMDGVLATGPSGDTAPGEAIYRTFREPPEELDLIRTARIPLHVLTAKEEAEARQVLEAVGLEGYIDSVIGANRLFWPTVRSALRRGRLPKALVKSVYQTVLPRPAEGRVVMIEDRRAHLLEMLGSGAIDCGILVPRMSWSEGRLVEWFDLNLAFRVARDLVSERWNTAELLGSDLEIFRWVNGEPERLGPGGGAASPAARLLLHLPSLSFADPPSAGPSLKGLHTGQVLGPTDPSVVKVVRGGLRLLRRAMGRLPASG